MMIPNLLDRINLYDNCLTSNMKICVNYETTAFYDRISMIFYETSFEMGKI